LASSRLTSRNLGCLREHLIDIAAEKIGDSFGRLARSQAVPQVLEIRVQTRACRY
jgi:hypothetical protein